MGNIADRGKSSEAQVRSGLEMYSPLAGFAFFRLPDARSGSRQPTLADFMVMKDGDFELLEVKEVKDHTFRLPHKNFDNLKVSRIRLWCKAGARAAVLVHFLPTNRWRLAPIEFFYTREGGSWDMSQFPALTLEQQMKELYGTAPNRT